MDHGQSSNEAAAETANVSSWLGSNGSTTLAGNKRSRTDSLTNPAINGSPSNNSEATYANRSAPEDELVESSSNENDSDSDDRASASQEYSLPQDHVFQAQRPDLEQFSKEKFETWRSRARYIAPPDDRLPPHKRLKTSKCRESSTTLEEEQDDSDGEFDVIYHADSPKGFFHLACPFYVNDPEKYQQCLLLHDLQSIEEVIGHIKRSHAKPPYCPRCSATFDTAIARDDHMLEGKCELQDMIPIDGVNLEQAVCLKKRDKYYRGQKKRWLRIWYIVFPASMAHDFWNFEGQQCVSEFLESRDLLRKGEERDYNALRKLALEDLLKGIAAGEESA
ncbi:hypothetical protein FALBO_6774 [Fusarium albosuccineum]|uniref:C2H2-type domain-containing protein n=1 Tax=Fusarium albosuccineum TaxID=1237068 RepID=A0A8H4LDL0_9HYPO|nr:hypothetical protein FALBO_6774 [Fusarium albosuccineum]